MGLIEKRLIKQGKEEWVPEAEKEILSMCGSAVAYDMDWDSFSADADALNNLRNFGLRRLSAALRVVCIDALGKEAIREQLKTIVVRNVADPAQKSITLEGSTLKVQSAFAKGAEGAFTDREMQLAIEKLL